MERGRRIFSDSHSWQVVNLTLVYCILALSFSYNSKYTGSYKMRILTMKWAMAGGEEK